MSLQWGILIAVAVGIIVGVSIFMYVLFLARGAEKDRRVAEFIDGVLTRGVCRLDNEDRVVCRMKALCDSLKSLDGYARSNKMAEGVLDDWLGSYGALLKKAVGVYCNLHVWNDRELESPVMFKIIDTVDDETWGILSRLIDVAEKDISASTADLLGKIAANHSGFVKMVEATK